MPLKAHNLKVYSYHWRSCNLRLELEIEADGLKQKLTMMVDCLHQIRLEKKALKIHEKEIEGNVNFEFQVDEIVHQEKEINGHATNCNTCKQSCHKRVQYSIKTSQIFLRDFLMGWKM